MIISRGLNEINIVSNNTKPVENEIDNVCQKSGHLTQIIDPTRPVPSLRTILGDTKKRRNLLSMVGSPRLRPLLIFNWNDSMAALRRAVRTSA